jgi:dienelactone hydrolase
MPISKTNALLAAAVATSIACRAACAQASDASLRVAAYDYDSELALLPRSKPLKDKLASQTALRKRWLISFESAHDQRVTAILALPAKSSGSVPAVILLAGSGGHKDTDYIRFAADMLATLGIASLAVDAQYHGDRARKGRSGDIHLIHSCTNRDAWIQTVVDLRRAVDYLQTRKEIDSKRIGYLGVSQGAILGGTFLGVEPRLAAACLALPAGGTVAYAKAQGLYKPENAARIERNAALTDPVHFVGAFAPRPLLVLAASRDELIPRSATEALYAAAGEPKQIRWYNSGHVLPPNALLVDAKRFFSERLGPQKP